MEIRNVFILPMLMYVNQQCNNVRLTTTAPCNNSVTSGRKAAVPARVSASQSPSRTVRASAQVSFIATLSLQPLT